MIAKHLISIMVQKGVNGVVKWVSRLLVCTRRSVYLKTDLGEINQILRNHKFLQLYSYTVVIVEGWI